MQTLFKAIFRYEVSEDEIKNEKRKKEGEKERWDWWIDVCEE